MNRIENQNRILYPYSLKLCDTIIKNYYMSSFGEVLHIANGRATTPYRQIFENHVYIPILDNNRTLRMVRLDKLVVSTLDIYADDVIQIIHKDNEPANCQLSNLRTIRRIDMIGKNANEYKPENLDDIFEEWKECSSDKRILISNFGRVRYTELDRQPNVMDCHGYEIIQYHGEKYFIHRLVAEAFVENPNPDKYDIVNHIDSIKNNNVFFNLEWCDISMNTAHYFHDGNIVKYTTEQIHKVCKLLEEGIPHIVIADITGVSRKFISEIYRGKKWITISSLYNIQQKPNRDEKYNREKILQLINSGMKCKKIAKELGIEYTQPFISYYEKLRRDIRLQK